MIAPTNKKADTLSEKVYDSLLNTLTFFFGMDVSDIDSIPDIEDDKFKAKGLESYTDYLRDVEDIKDEFDIDIPKVKEVVEEVDVVEYLPEPGEFKRVTYKIHLPPKLAARLGDADVDHSYPALKYLESLGYKQFDFIVNPAHKKNDICDEIARANPWELSGVLSSAEEDADAKDYPVAPIFNLTHVNSKGYFQVSPPASVDDIPDDAPGLINDERATPEQLAEDKQRLFGNLTVVDVTRLTYAPDMFEVAEIAPSTELRQEVFPEEYEGSRSQLVFTSDEDIELLKIAEILEVAKPFEISKTVFLKQPLGFMQMLPKGFKGFILEQDGEVTKAYIYNLDSTFIIPADITDVLDFNVSGSDKVMEGDFIVVDDEIGIVIDESKEDLDIIAYLPSFGGVVTTDTWQVLETR